MTKLAGRPRVRRRNVSGKLPAEGPITMKGPECQAKEHGRSLNVCEQVTNIVFLFTYLKTQV